MGEVILFGIAAFMGGWVTRGVVNYKTSRLQQLGKPEMMWFNEQRSRWERVTELSLHVAERVVVSIPVKLVEQSNE